MPAVGDQHRGPPSTVSNMAATVTANPFEEGPRRMSEYTAQEVATLQSRLDKQLGPEYISSRAGPSGQKVHYLAAEKCINLANEVFGFNGWSSSIQSIQIDFVDESPNTGKISLGLSVIIRVTLRDGTYHEDVGYGHIENCKGKAAAFEKAKKEGTTDGLKRALRTFGNVLGNCVYDKEYLAKVTRVKVAPSKWDVDNLHRHPDFAPIKKEPAPERKLPEEVELPPQPTTKGSAPPPAMSMLVDGDGEFGSDVFDEADFVAPTVGNPDEISLDVGTPQPPQRSYPRPQLPPAQQISQGTSSHPPGNPSMVTPSKPEKQWTAGPGPATRPMFHGNSTNPTAANVHRNAESRQAIVQGQALSNNRTGQESQQTNNRDKIKLENPPGPANLRTASNTQIPPAQNEQSASDKVPPDAAVGFYSARAVDTLRENPQASPMAPRFDPHAESPSIRKTAGIDHTKSVPISKPMLSTASPSTTGARDFINPSTDVHRRIGAPGGGGAMASPGNRGFTTSSYRPLTRPNIEPKNAGANPPTTTPDGVLKRPPLGDVTNAPKPDTAVGISGPGDPKRPRLDESANPRQVQQQ
ncbi:DNA repair and recombination protein radC [Talaromyces islandicus]|uniref:RAD52 homolog n=1 Tax=Talaromyces islandicus TaxID=28573 RepID=A0A0U1LQ30_TALIS|nr:DNA repair and recombination protein radC [Talaromyces islandicus]